MLNLLSCPITEFAFLFYPLFLSFLAGFILFHYSFFLFSCTYNSGSLIYALMILNAFAGIDFYSVISFLLNYIYNFRNFPTSILISTTEILEANLH